MKCNFLYGPISYKSYTETYPVFKTDIIGKQICYAQILSSNDTSKIMQFQSFRHLTKRKKNAFLMPKKFPIFAL